MGKIKSTMEKKTAHELMKQDFPFSGEFNNNKKLLGNTMPSKKVRNKIAGYITRLSRRKKEAQ